MKHLIIGAGGTGGALGAYLAKEKKDVTFIARGAHLAAMKEEGLRVIRPEDEFTIKPVRAWTQEDYLSILKKGCTRNADRSETEKPDVIWVCVKGYSLADVVPFIKEAAGEKTIIIPILNIYGTGGKLQEKLPDLLVTDGCIYVASEIASPGTILMKGDIMRVVFGLRDEKGAERMKELEEICDELAACDIIGELSDNIQRDALLKFSYVSPAGACGIYHSVTAKDMQKPGKYRDCFTELICEIDELAHAMGITFKEDIVKRNLDILDGLDPSATTSMQRDYMAGKSTEIDGLIGEVVRLGETYGLAIPEYRKIAAALGVHPGHGNS